MTEPKNNDDDINDNDINENDVYLIILKILEERERIKSNKLVRKV
jgi:hypothetical protein